MVKQRANENLSNRDTSIVYSSKIDPILEEFADELARIAPIPPGIVEADFDPNDDISSDDDSYEGIEYVDATPPNLELVSLEEVEDVILRDKLSNVYLLISKIEALNDNSTLSSFSNNSFSDHTKETRNGSTITHTNYSLPEYDLFLFEIEPDQEGLISIDNSNNTILEFPEFESFHFDPSVPRPPPEPPDVEKCFEPKAVPRPPPEPSDVEKCFEPKAGFSQQFLKTLVSGVVLRSTRASHPFCEISLGRSNILSS
ncbi:hypothetical protein Tco_1493832 [Tanacetum coccineum]